MITANRYSFKLNLVITISLECSNIIVNPYPGVDGLHYIDFPETETEFERCSGLIDIMDGQHRLYSFSDKYVKIPDNSTYEIEFTWYIDPSLAKRQQIFISCNAKQEKVNSNLLMWFKHQLQMLNDEEIKHHERITKLNENIPLKGKVIMSAEKIKYGYKAKEVMEALKQANVMQLSFNGTPLDQEQLLAVLRAYLTAWEKVCGFSFTESKATQAGAAVKLAGLRFMLYLLKPIWDRSIMTKSKFNGEFVENTIRDMITNYNCECKNFFTAEEHKLWFRDRTAIKENAENAGRIVIDLGSGSFNPLD